MKRLKLTMEYDEAPSPAEVYAVTNPDRLLRGLTHMAEFLRTKRKYGEDSKWAEVEIEFHEEMEALGLDRYLGE